MTDNTAIQSQTQTPQQMVRHFSNARRKAIAESWRPFGQPILQDDPFARELGSQPAAVPDTTLHVEQFRDVSYKGYVVTEDGVITRRPDAHARTNLAQECFREAFARESLTLDDLSIHRIRVTYRLVRSLARYAGVAMDSDLLQDVVPCHKTGNLSPWSEPGAFARTEQFSAPSHVSTRLMDHRETLTLLPPPIPQAFLTTHGYASNAYDPYDDIALVGYCQILERIAESVNIEAGAASDPHYGRLGLVGLLDPISCRLAFPSQLEIVAYEMLLVEEAVEVMVKKGPAMAPAVLADWHGFRSFEVVPIIKGAKALIRLRSGADPDEERALMLMRLDEYASRARECGDLRNELAALKQIATVSGITRTETDNPLVDFITAVRDASENRQIRMAPVPMHIALPPPPEGQKSAYEDGQ